MQDLFATRLEIASEDPDAEFASVVADVAGWASRGGREVADLLGEREGRFEVEGGAITWRLFRLANDPDAALRVVLNHGDDEHPGLRWLSGIDVVRVATGVTVSIRLTRLATEMRIAPANLDLHPPRLVGNLIQRHACTCGDGIAVTTGARELQPGDISNFGRDVLTKPDRRLPVIVLSSPPGRSSPEANPEQVARELAGLAHIYVLSGHLASERLTAALGAGLRVPSGGARLYWPGLGGTGQSIRHPHWTRRALRNQPGRRPFSRFVFSMLAPLSVLRVPLDPEVWRIRNADAVRRRRELTERTADEAIGDALEQLEQMTELEQDLEKALLELEEKNALLLKHEENWTTVGTALPSANDVDDQDRDGGEPLPPTTWDEVIELCEILEESGAFVLTERARSMLAPGHYPDPDRMYQHLEALANAAEAYRESGGDIDQRFTEWAHHNFGIEIALHDEGLTRSGRDRFAYEGVEHSGEPHVKVDDHVSPDRCGRIYFARDHDNLRFIVDHVGLHR